MILLSVKGVCDCYVCIMDVITRSICPLGYERVYLPLHKVADTPLHIQRDDTSSFLYTTEQSGIYQISAQMGLFVILIIRLRFLLHNL